MKKDKQMLHKTKEAADIVMSYGSENDEELLAYLAKQDVSLLSRLRVYFSNPTFTLIYFIKWAFTSSLIAAFLTTVASDTIPYIHTPGILLYLLAVLFLLSTFTLIRFFVMARKGVLQQIKHFAKRSENARIVSMIDFVLKQNYKNVQKNLDTSNRSF
ncbi:hypothetical protein [Bacillus haynesii]|uniref:hypothetical protein n=1 Tax=Bacillus haynesii TaxID=1925021 RepID=UPI0012B86918|nr:hypothetical protein [Bacillus haynesii]TWK14606.1 hypothetical protein CHCC20375_1657 [Bacillus licheniformis]MBU8684889.1 hypothetical protein [Bacillus haynesii]MCY7838063.1 hypothetical protein [Bacillus haynesii]MCY7844401.1 hypothetical protein [Bacillus haynesii]MCY7991595.1 hypothetical protein [Bacillus haynesii]